MQSLGVRFGSVMTTSGFLLQSIVIGRLFSFESLQRESVSSLLSFVNTLREIVAALKALGVVDLSGFLLFYIGARVIDSDTRRLFEASIPQEIPTAIMRIQDQSGKLVPVRALLDTGSQMSAITNQCAIHLGLPRHKGRVEVSGLAQQLVRTVKGSTNCSFSPLLYDVPQISATNVVILPKITALMPNQKLPISIRERYGHLPLADPNFDVPGSVDLLIGGDLYPFILQP